jgi:HPt (histidine-containing phosphotransfer) domain-containing protein
MTASSLDPAVLASLIELADGDKSFLDELLATYLEQSVETIEALRIALEQSDMTTARREAHRLAGASLNIGATAAASLCRRIEDAALRRSEPEMQDCLIRLVVEVAAVRAESGARATPPAKS